MKIGVLIPDRGDRPQFLAHMYRMLSNQTLQPHQMELINDPPLSDKCDITFRYRIGYAKFSDVDVIAFIENDDWYSPHYLEKMAHAWDAAGRPDLFGTDFTIYYHLKLRKWIQMDHLSRASAMNTMIKPGLTSIHWPVDHDPFTDMWLWMRQDNRITKRLWHPSTPIALGIKHGVGKTGGKYHGDELAKYSGPRGHDDQDQSFLQSIVDEESFKFYSEFACVVQ